MEGYLGYNSENKRYGMLVRDLWEIDGFHCGDCFEVYLEGKWIPTRIEYTNQFDMWYLVGTDLIGKYLEHRKIRV